MATATLTDTDIRIIKGEIAGISTPIKATKQELAMAKKEEQPTFVTGEPMDSLIGAILCTKRAHNSKGELAFVSWLYSYLEGLKLKPVAMAEGAVVVEIGKGGKTLFSCHLDTVHNTTESDGSMQSIFFDDAFQHIFLADKKSTCLGADDGAGIYIMLRMIEAQVVGTYIFHRGEERGGISAQAMKDKYPDYLKRFDACIAFDRPNDHEVIITQGGAICASVAYGNQLADALNAQGLKYETSTKGVFTDSKVYRQLIPECINIGVGYYNQHGSEEYQDWAHLSALTKAVIALDWSALKPQRKIDLAENIYGGSNKWKGGMDYSFGKTTDQKNTGTVGKPLFSPVPEFDEADLDVDFETLTKEEIDDYMGGDSSLTGGIIRLLCDLDAEKARVTRLQMLLGL